MPRYFFDTHNGALVRDEVGIVCSNFKQVLAQATAGLADFAKDAIPGANLHDMAVRVRDDQDRPVLQTTLRLEIKPLK